MKKFCRWKIWFFWNIWRTLEISCVVRSDCCSTKVFDTTASAERTPILILQIFSLDELVIVPVIVNASLYCKDLIV